MYLTYYAHLVGIKRRNCENAWVESLKKEKVIDSRIAGKGEKFLGYVCDCQLHRYSDTYS